MVLPFFMSYFRSLVSFLWQLPGSIPGGGFILDGQALRRGSYAGAWEASIHPYRGGSHATVHGMISYASMHGMVSYTRGGGGGGGDTV